MADEIDNKPLTLAEVAAVLEQLHDDISEVVSDERRYAEPLYNSLEAAAITIRRLKGQGPGLTRQI